MFGKSENINHDISKIQLKNVNEIEKQFANLKNIHEWKSIQKKLKTVRDFFIHKMFAESRKFFISKYVH